MYGSCVKLSDTIAVTHTAGEFKLFEVSDSGAKEVDSGTRLHVSSQDRVLAIGSKELQLYNFEGDTLIDTVYSLVHRVAPGIYTVQNGRNYRLELIDNKGNRILRNTFLDITIYTNGLGEATSRETCVWFTWRNQDGLGVKKVQFEGRSFAFDNGVAVPNRANTNMTIFDTSLKKIGETTNQVGFRSKKIPLLNGDTFETGNGAWSISFKLLGKDWDSWSSIEELQANIQS